MKTEGFLGREVVELSFHSLLPLHRGLLDDSAQLRDDVVVHVLSVVRELSRLARPAWRRPSRRLAHGGACAYTIV